jgi:hypothetical protein
MKKKEQVGKRKYKVEFTQTETFVVDVYAKNEKEAKVLATRTFDAGDYQEQYDCAVELSCVYDVTNTDDLFCPQQR